MGSPLMCEWADGVCIYCGYKIPQHIRGPVARNCTSWRAGDDLEQALTNLGITKERYIALKEALHLAPSCNCDDRKEWLNDQSHKLQLAVADLSRILKIWYHKPR